MKKIRLSLVALIALSSQSFAGGDILPPEAYEAESIIVKPVAEVIEPVGKIVKTKVMTPVVKDNSAWYAGVGLVVGRTRNVHC